MCAPTHPRNTQGRVKAGTLQVQLQFDLNLFDHLLML